MSSVLFAFLILVALGLLLSIGLFYADKKLSIKKDEKLVQIESIMPGANCGGCGFAGCADYANAVFSGTAKPGLCSVGGQELADKMGSILGIESSKVEKKVAYCFCSASCNDVVKQFDYKGNLDCNQAAMLFNGDNGCKYSCLHLLSCKNVCEQNAIKLDEKGNIVVDRSLCIGCGKCVNVCPHHVIKLIPYDLKYAVKCNSHDNGATVRKNCSVGCIGCKICEIKYPESGIKVDNNLANVTACNNEDALNNALNACPRKVINKINI